MIKKKKEEIIIQSPFTPETLLTSGSFVSYCSDNGKKIQIKDLENLHKNGLLFPALKIYRGVVAMKKVLANFNGKKEWRLVYQDDVKKFKPLKIDPKNYYSSGGFFMSDKNVSGHDWLKPYQDSKMIERPADKSFKPWIEMTAGFKVTNRKKIEKSYEYFYDRRQLFVLKIIGQHLNFLKILKNKEKIKYKKQLLEQISDFYKFLSLYYRLEECFLRIKKCHNKYFENLTDKERETYIRAETEGRLRPLFKEETQKILKEFGVELEYIKNWRKFLAEKNLVNESVYSQKIKKAYLKAIDDDQLVKAEDVNRMIFILNFFLEILTKEKISVKSVVADSAHNFCVICGNSFKPGRKNQVTCGDTYCIEGHKKRWKKAQRKVL